MNKNDIDQIQIEIECGGESALSMMLHSDGTFGRSGSGSLPRNGIAVLGMIGTQVFKTLIDSLDERVFPHVGTYEIKDKLGTPVTYSIAFLRRDKPLALFEFRIGLENRDAGNLLAYFDGFIQHAIALTNDWYKSELAKKQGDGKESRIKCNVLLATKSPEDIIDKGVIDKEGAKAYFLKFPFLEEIKKRQLNSDLMAPTITYHDDEGEMNLAIWSEEDGKYTIWFPPSMTPLNNVTNTDVVVKCIDLFFDRKYEELSQYIGENCR